MSAGQDELAALRAEVAALREEIRQLHAALPATQVYLYPPAAPLPMYAVQPGAIPWQYQTTMCAGGWNPGQTLEVIVP